MRFLAVTIHLSYEMHLILMLTNTTLIQLLLNGITAILDRSAEVNSQA